MKFSMTIFLILLLFIGLGLTVISFVLAGYVEKCSINAQNAVRGLLTMGVSLFSICGTMLVCKCAEKFDQSGSILNTVFPVLLLLISGVTIGLVATIHNECEKARKITPVLIALSVFITLGTTAYIGKKIYKKIKPDDVVSPSPNPSLASSSKSSSVSDNSPLLGG